MYMCCTVTRLSPFANFLLIEKAWEAQQGAGNREKERGRGKGIQSGKTGANSLEGQQPLHTHKTGIQFLK
jgi:hypothetical protein